jgi:hypothetical protein
MATTTTTIPGWPPTRTAGISFEVDDRTAELLARLQKIFGVDTNAAVIRKAVALASIAGEQAGADKTVTIAGAGKAPVKVSLAD